MALCLQFVLCLLLTLVRSQKKISPSDYMVQHNQRRCLHGAKDLVWSESVARSAQKHADACIFQHTDPAVFGECLWAGYYTPEAEDCLWGWYDNEIGDYPWDSPGYYKATGHFTQVVWANTRELGCGICDGWGRGQYPYMATCQYNLGGNVGGQYGNMVKPVTKTAAECKADCGPPNQRGWDFSGCNTKFPGKCDPKCRTGYWAPRGTYALCQSDGTWWFDGICNANTCHSPLPSHPDPNVDMSSCMNGIGLEHEGTCAPKCKAGYYGNPTAVCQAIAVWKYGGSCAPCGGPCPTPGTPPADDNVTDVRNQTLVVNGTFGTATFCDGATDGHFEVLEDGAGDSIRCDCPGTCTMNNPNPGTVCPCNLPLPCTAMCLIFSQGHMRAQFRHKQQQATSF